MYDAFRANLCEQVVLIVTFFASKSCVFKPVFIILRLVFQPFFLLDHRQWSIIFLHLRKERAELKRKDFIYHFDCKMEKNSKILSFCSFIVHTWPIIEEKIVIIADHYDNSGANTSGMKDRKILRIRH